MATKTLTYIDYSLGPHVTATTVMSPLSTSQMAKLNKDEPFNDGAVAPFIFIVISLVAMFAYMVYFVVFITLFERQKRKERQKSPPQSPDIPLRELAPQTYGDDAEVAGRDAARYRTYLNDHIEEEQTSTSPASGGTFERSTANQATSSKTRRRGKGKGREFVRGDEARYEGGRQ